MTMSNLARLVTGVSTALAILAACNGGAQSQFAPAEPVLQTTQPGVAHSPLDALGPLQSVRRNRKSDLIYVSAQGSGYIYVFTYPGLQLSLFALPAPKETAEGFCSDRKGNVWVVESLGVFEYAHGGNLQTAGFLESGDPFGCAVNPTNGDLAVANFDPPNQATVAVTDPKTAGPSGGWKLYTDAAFQGFVYCGYDDEGNLFVSGYTASNVIGLAELPKARRRSRTSRWASHCTGPPACSGTANTSPSATESLRFINSRSAGAKRRKKAAPCWRAPRRSTSSGSKGSISSARTMAPAASAFGNTRPAAARSTRSMGSISRSE